MATKPKTPWTSAVNKYVRSRDFSAPEDLIQIVALKQMAAALDVELNASLVAQFQKALSKLEEGRVVANPIEEDPNSDVDPLLLPE